MCLRMKPAICKIYACYYMFVGCSFKPLMYIQYIRLVSQRLDGYSAAMGTKCFDTHFTV